MNTLFALYLWLMQFLGVPGVVVIGGNPAIDNVRSGAVTAPHEEGSETPCAGDQQLAPFISNGF